MNRSLSTFFACLPIAACTAALLLAPTGCNPVGCFEASYSGGTCPAQKDALPYFGDPGCGVEVASLDSEPSLQNGKPEEGTLCCYAISTQDPDYSGCPDF